jgi:type VI secretion system secreted protein Hcp
MDRTMPAPTLFDEARGGSDVFLHLQCKRAGKIKGEATSPGHVDDIVVKGWAWGLAASSAIGSTQATARRSWKALTLTKGVDRASTPLMSALVANDEIKEARFSLRRAGGTQGDYYVIVLQRGRIASLDQTVDAAGTAVETISIVFNKIDVEYRQQQNVGDAGATSSFADEIFTT